MARSNGEVIGRDGYFLLLEQFNQYILRLVWEEDVAMRTVPGLQRYEPCTCEQATGRLPTYDGEMFMVALTTTVLTSQQIQAERPSNAELVLEVDIQVLYRRHPSHKGSNWAFHIPTNFGAPSLSRCACIFTVEENLDFPQTLLNSSSFFSYLLMRELEKAPDCLDPLHGGRG